MYKNKIKLFHILLLLVSASVTAATSFTDGPAISEVTIQGNIDVPAGVMYWEWQIGASNSVFDSTTNALSNAKKLIIPVARGIPVLLAHTNNNITTGDVMSRPSMVLTTTGGKSIPLDFSVATVNSSAGQLKIPVTDDSATMQIGMMTLNVKAAAVQIAKSNTSSAVYVNTIISSSGNAIASEMLPMQSDKGMNYTDTIAFLSLMGAQTPQYVLNKLNEPLTIPANKNSVLPSPSSITPTSSTGTMNAGWYNGISYALGVPANGEIIIDFDNAISTNTKWKAAMNINVSYM